MKYLAAALIFIAASANAADFKVTITDQSSLDGIAWARAQYNAALPKDDKGDVVGTLATDQDYMTMIVQQAAASYAGQSIRAKTDDAMKDAMTGNTTKLDALSASMKK